MLKMFLGYRLLCNECGDKVCTWTIKEGLKVTQREAFEGVDRELVDVKHSSHTFVKLNFRARTIEGLWKKIDESEDKLKSMLAAKLYVLGD